MHNRRCTYCSRVHEIRKKENVERPLYLTYRKAYNVVDKNKRTCTFTSP